MIDVGRLRDAVDCHEAQQRADHRCGPWCSAALAQALATDAGLLGRAWREHWHDDPEWRWNEQYVEDADHRYGPSCADPMATRLTNRS